MALVIRCNRCEKDHEVTDDILKEDIIDCPFCNNSASRNSYASIMFCPHCYSEVHVPLDVIHRELQCPYCDKVFHSNVSFSLNDDDEEHEDKILEKNISDNSLAADDIFDKYKIIKLLGKGGMGEVYLAQHMLLNREVALKILNPNAASSNKIYAKRFIREAKLANKINSENFIAVFDAGIDNRSGSLFIAMEFVDGKNLNEIIRERGTFDETEILQVAYNVANVLCILERENIVHRDIKPSNIMIDNNGVVKLADFGIAKSENTDENDLTLTQGNMVFGTPNYASPEQCKSSHHVDFRSDIYSLGATMFHMAAGVPPYDGTTAMETVLKVLNEEPRDLSVLIDGFSDGFILLVKDMLKRDPEKRPPNAEALKMRVEHLLNGKQPLSVRMKFKARILASQLRLWGGNFCEWISETIKKFPKSAFKRFIKTVSLIIILFLIVVVTLRHRNSLIGIYNKAKQFVVKFTSPEQKKIAVADNQPKEEIPKPVEIEQPKAPEPVKVQIEEKKPPVEKPVVRKKVRRKRKRVTKNEAPAEVKKTVKKKSDDRFYHDALRNAIFSRLEKCNKELKHITERESYFADRSWYIDRVEFYKKLQKNLFKQLRERERAFVVKNSKGFSKDISASITAMVYEYSKNEHKEPFTADDKIFAQQLLHYVKNSKSDPNVYIKDYRHAKFSGPLLRWIEHANMPMKKEIFKELMLHHVSADCIKENCSIELCKYGVLSMKGMLTLNIKNKKYDNAVTLIDHGADVNEIDQDGRTPLHWAILYNDMKMVRYLLMAGANINGKEQKDMQTPLFYAEKYASKDIRDFLLSLGADENIIDKHGHHYQHYSYFREFNQAILKNDMDNITSLLQTYPELSNYELSGGLTPLQNCCRQNNTKVILELLKHKADPNAISGVCPYTPLQLTYEYPENRRESDSLRLVRWGIFTSLLQNGANAAVPPIAYNYPTLLQFSLSNIAGIDERHIYFITSMISSYDTSSELAALLYHMYNYKLAYYSGDKYAKLRERILNQLLLRRPNLSAEKFDMIFPLIAWSPYISESDLDKLIRCKVNVNGKDKYGRNALYMLCTYISQNRSYIDSKSIQLLTKRIKYLLKKGVDKKCKVNNISIQDMDLPELIMPLVR